MMAALFVLLGAAIVVSVLGLFVVRSESDVTAFLTVFVVLLIGINARWVVPGAGALGTPAMLLAAFAAWWWWMARFSPQLGIDRGPNPVRIALLAYLWFVVLSWGLAQLRPLTPIEVGGSNRAIIMAFAMTGVALLIADGVGSIERLERILRRVVVGGAAFSAVGVLQFAFDLDLVAVVAFPGLIRNNEAIQAIALRSGLSRAEGTALHSIEFGVVLAVILPLALFFARRSVDSRSRKWNASMAALIAAGIPLTISRSGLLAAAAALAVASLGWTWRDRMIGAVTAFGGMVAMGIVVPGLIGTFRALILGANEDPSVTARLDRVPLVEERYWQSPWVGEGIGTFSPDDDFLLDNQYFGTLLDMGVIGLVVVLALFGVSIVACWRVGRNAEDAATREFAYAVMAGIAVLPVVMATFDAFFYRILMGVSFILIGAAGALWRVEVRMHPTSTVASQLKQILKLDILLHGPAGEDG